MVNLKQLKGFQPDQYTRHLVLKTDNVEIIVVCWLPGQASPVHGHGESDGVMIVLEGELSFTNHYPDGRKISGVAVQGDICHTPVGVQHEVSNQGKNELITLHVYAPPLNPKFQGFDLGYQNPVELKEVHLPKATVQFLMAAAAETQDSIAYDI